MEDHRINDHRTGRLGVLLDQFDFARQIAQARLDGLASPASLPKGAPLAPSTGDGPLSDEEYLWEPAPGAWSIRRRGQAASPRPFGPGQWQLDSASGAPLAGAGRRGQPVQACLGDLAGEVELVQQHAKPAGPMVVYPMVFHVGSFTVAAPAHNRDHAAAAPPAGQRAARRVLAVGLGRWVVSWSDDGDDLADGRAFVGHGCLLRGATRKKGARPSNHHAAPTATRREPL